MADKYVNQAALQYFYNKLKGTLGGTDTIPIGTVVRWDNNVLPDDGLWVWCDQEYERTEYPELFIFCGTRFNLDTTPSTKFRTPKSDGYVAVGLKSDDNDFKDLNKTGGEKANITKDTQSSETDDIYVVTNFIIKAKKQSVVDPNLTLEQVLGEVDKKNYATKEYVDGIVGNIENLLKEV